MSQGVKKKLNIILGGRRSESRKGAGNLGSTGILSRSIPSILFLYHHQRKASTHCHHHRHGVTSITITITIKQRAWLWIWWTFTSKAPNIQVSSSPQWMSTANSHFCNNMFNEKYKYVDRTIHVLHFYTISSSDPWSSVIYTFRFSLILVEVITLLVNEKLKCKTPCLWQYIEQLDYVMYSSLCDNVWRYMARFGSNKKKLYIGFIGEREAVEYIATSNIGLFNIFLLVTSPQCWSKKGFLICGIF